MKISLPDSATFFQLDLYIPLNVKNQAFNICLTVYNTRMRKNPIIQNEYYHVFNRGNNKQQIFFDIRDWARFLFLVIYFQSPIIHQNISRQVTSFVKSSVFNIKKASEIEMVKNRTVDLVSFAMMPNHFHLLLKEHKNGGIAQYMQRILCSYTKYFNTKYEKSGHLFQGPYKAVGVNDNVQLLYLSTYIHRNPRELPKWKNKEHLYPWSSYQDYTTNNRWDELLQQNIILSQFSNKKEYEQFLKSSPAKELKENLNQELFVD